VSWRMGANLSGDAPWRNPITRAACCCASTTCASETVAAAPPTSVLNCRRPMSPMGLPSLWVGAIKITTVADGDRWETIAHPIARETVGLRYFRSADDRMGSEM
jgi:hypothetical protein